MPELALQHALAFVRLPPRLRITQSAGEPFNSQIYRLPTSGPAGPRHIVAQQAN
jgi:hypothetical protein